MLPPTQWPFLYNILAVVLARAGMRARLDGEDLLSRALFNAALGIRERLPRYFRGLTPFDR